MENHAIELAFHAGRDNFTGSLRSLTEHRDEAFDLLKLSLTAPRFDTADVERARMQITAALRRDTTSPNSLASRAWWSAAFPDHPYGRESRGTLESVPTITADDMLRAVLFCDAGTVEQDTNVDWDDFRVAPGFGLRIAHPGLGPAPIALDLTFPFAHAQGDNIRNFTFFIGLRY